MSFDSTAPDQAVRTVRLQGATLLQLMLGTVSVLLLVIIMGKLVLEHNRRARCNAYLNDVKHFASLFQTYYKQEGQPPPGNQGVPGYPKGMEPYLKDTSWLKPSPVGGHYSWVSYLDDPDAKTPNKQASARLGAIALTGFRPKAMVKLSQADLVYIKERLNSGDFSGLKYASGFTGWPLCNVSPPP